MLGEECQVAAGVVGEGERAERVLGREPAPALPLGLGERIVRIVPGIEEHVAVAAATSHVVPKRDDPVGIERKPQLLLELAMDGAGRVAAVLRLLAAAEHAPVSRERRRVVGAVLEQYPTARGVMKEDAGAVRPGHLKSVPRVASIVGLASHSGFAAAACISATFWRKAARRSSIR